MERKLLALVLVCLLVFFFLPGIPVSAAEKQIKLVFADMVPEVTVAAQCTKWWGSEIEKRTGGKVKIEYYFGASLMGAYEQLSAVKNNVVQITPYYSGYHPDIAPIPLMALFPMMNVGNLEDGLKAADEFFRNNSEVQKEFKKNNVKYMNPLFTANAYMWSKGPISSVEDFKGLSVRAFGPWLSLFGAMGSRIVSVPVPEIYNSLERGVVKSTLLYLTNGVGLNLFEVTDHLNVTNLGHNCGMPLVMNLETWNGLPENLKKVIEQVNKESISKFYSINQKNYGREMELVKKKGMKINKFPQAEVDKMKQIAREKVWDPYAKKLDEKGMKGTEILNDLIKCVDKY